MTRIEACFNVELTEFARSVAQAAGLGAASWENDDTIGFTRGLV
jgi:hypothetical protein